MAPSSASRLAWSLWALYVIFQGTGLLLMPMTDPALLGSQILYGIAALGFPTVGALIATRQPGNAIGWLFCLAPTLTVFGLFAEQYFLYSVVLRPGALPFPALIGWLGLWLSTLGFTVTLTFTLLLFPTGRLPSPRWRPVAWAGGALMAIFATAQALQPGPLHERTPEVMNPFGLDALTDIFTVMDDMVWPFLLLIGLCAASVVARFLAARDVERQQLKWFAFAAGMLALVFVFFETLQEESPSWLPVAIGDAVFSLAIAGVPAAAGVAILRYRLYDIDLIIRRTLVYGTISGLLVVVYLTLVVVLQSVFRALTGQGSDIAIIASTLAIAALFQPARHGIQRFIDRRFYRNRYDANQTLTRFMTRLRDEVDLPMLQQELVMVVRETMQPSQVSLWVRPSVTTPSTVSRRGAEE